MTDEVGRLVLADNEDQNDLMGTSRANAASLLPVHARMIKDFVTDRGLNRELEALPSEKEIRRRTEAGIGLTSPELATLMAHVKLALKDDLLASDLPDQEVFAAAAAGVLPGQAAGRSSRAEIRIHQLRREIVTTMLVNDLVDTSGITYAYRITEDVGVGPVDAVRSYVADRRDLPGRRGVAADPRRRTVSVAVIRPDDAGSAPARSTGPAAGCSTTGRSRWRSAPRSTGSPTKWPTLTPRMSEWLRGDDKAIVDKEAARVRAHGVSEDLAYMVATGLYQYSLLDVIDIADIVDREPAEVADTYFALMDHLGTDGLLTAVSRLGRDDRWHSLARLAIRDDIYGSLRALCFDVLAVGEPDETGEEKIAEWEMTNSSRVARARRTLDRDLRGRATGPGHAVGGGAPDPQHDANEWNGNIWVTTGFVAPVHVRWSDIDMYQHINHATMVTILEEARIPFLREPFGADITTIGLLIAEVQHRLQGPAAAGGFAAAGDDVVEAGAGGRLHHRLRGAAGERRTRLEAVGDRRDAAGRRAHQGTTAGTALAASNGSTCSAGLR